MAKRKRLPPPELEELERTFIEMLIGADREIALVQGAYLEDALTAFLKSCVVDDKNVIESLFRVDGPLATFSTKINAAYAFGHISQAIYSDLHSIREIRNLFAHHRASISFDSEDITKWTKRLSTIKPHVRTFPLPRHQFTLTTMFLTAYLIARTDDVVRKARFTATAEENLLLTRLLADHVAQMRRCLTTRISGSSSSSLPYRPGVVPEGEM